MLSPRLPKLLLILAAVVSIGVSTVWQHLRALRAGYRLAALEAARERLHAERRFLEVMRAREERLDRLEERARKIGVPIPGERSPEADGG